MNMTLQFDPQTHQLAGPSGALPIAAADQLARRFLMLVEGECLEDNVSTIAEKYGFCRQRYYQLLETFKSGGLLALGPQRPPLRSSRKSSPKLSSRSA